MRHRTIPHANGVHDTHAWHGIEWYRVDGALLRADMTEVVFGETQGRLLVENTKIVVYLQFVCCENMQANAAVDSSIFLLHFVVACCGVFCT